MVLVLLGTQDKEFKRLLVEVEKLVKDKVIKDEVVVQNGNTKYDSKYMKCIGFITHDELISYIEKSDYVITHGGVGSIIEVLEHNKKVIAVARLQEYHEHENNHQLEIINKFKDNSFLLDGTYDLKSCIQNINKFKPNKYKSNKENFLAVLENYIENN